jgi:Arc/MetJ-type ribon-helix-helix transcriptional regulator
MSITIETEVPEQLWQQAQTMVDKGWANNMNELVSESVRRYLESHQESTTERFIREDVEWGLRCHD